MPRRKDKLTDMQRAFVEHYTAVGTKTHNNGAQAAIAAGYSPKGADVQASRLLVLDKVKRAIDAKYKAKRAKIEYNYDIAIESLNKVISNLEPLAAKGNIQANRALTDAIREKNAITGLHTQTVKTQDISRPDISDAERQALADLARRYNIKLAAG